MEQREVEQREVEQPEADQPEVEQLELTLRPTHGLMRLIEICPNWFVLLFCVVIIKNIFMIMIW